MTPIPMGTTFWNQTIAWSVVVVNCCMRLSPTNKSAALQSSMAQKTSIKLGLSYGKLCLRLAIINMVFRAH